MTRMVRAAVQTAPRSLEMREFPRPTTGAEDGLLRVEANGICGSDVETYAGHMGDPNRSPFIPGHEPVGIIEEIGDVAAERWGVNVGDRVALEVIVPCRQCQNCLTGRYQACSLRKYGHGVTGIDVAPALWGGFAEHMYLSPTSVVHKIDASLPIELASLYNAMGAGVRWAVDLGEVGLGDTLLVLGAGQRGIGAVIAAKAAGAKKVIITGLERDAHKLEAARALGADHTIVVDGENAQDVVEAVREYTDGAMVDVALEVTPMAHQPIRDALGAVRFGGRVVLAGLKGRKEVSLITDDLINRSLTVRGAFGVDSDAQEKAIALIESRRFDLEKLHTHSFGLDEVELAIDTLSGAVGDGQAIGVSVNPNA